jgi:hypothetical protein
MSKLVVFESLTLDGVMQAPGRPDEDRRGGFQHGGWAAPYADPVMSSVSGEGMAKGGALLFGRRLFADGGAFARLRLVDAKTTTKGVVIATYRPAEE